MEQQINIDPALLDELSKSIKSEKDLAFLSKQLLKRTVERAMDAELDDHLGYEKYAIAGKNTGNSRNGYSLKRLEGDFGQVDINTPRDRNSTFEPRIIRKGQTRFTEFDEQILALYARGMTTRDISDTFKELYGTEVSHSLISKVTESVIDEITVWQNRPLAGVYPIQYLDCIVIRSSTGSPQGGVISPTLANIYLHYVIDLWVTKSASRTIKGEMYNFRYADDLLFCFQFKDQAIKFRSMLEVRLQKFGLALNLDKSKLCRFGRFAKANSQRHKESRSTFTFLGFTVYNGISRQGKYKVGCRTESRRLSAAMNRVTKWCQEHKHQALAWQARYLNAVLRGHYNYYGVTGNYPSISSFYRHVVKMWHKYLSRRSQRGYIKWDEYWKITKKYGLIKPYLPHSVLYNYCQYSC